MRRIPYRFVARYAGNVIRARIPIRQNKKLIKPMIAGIYLTMKCNFRCTYCDDGSGSMYPELGEQRLDTAKTVEVLKILARACPGLNVTGGEPTLRADIDEILDQIGRLRFAPVIINTNAFLLDQHLSMLHNADYLIISLDAIHEGRSDDLINLRKPGQTQRVKRNIQLALDYRRDRGPKFDFIINTVILPETIDDAWEVFEFCIRHDLCWTPMPHVVGKYPNPGLVDNPRWQHLIDQVTRAKLRGVRVYGNLEALRTIRDFKRFECYPTIHPIIYPNGDIFYPCGPLNKVAANLVETGDYFEAMKLGERKYGPIPYCDARCHVGCYTEGSTAITHPEKGIAEIIGYLARRRTKQIVLEPPVRASGATALPTFAEMRLLPSLPPDTVRQLRKKGMLENDLTSRLRIKP